MPSAPARRAAALFFSTGFFSFRVGGQTLQGCLEAGGAANYYLRIPNNCCDVIIVAAAFFVMFWLGALYFCICGPACVAQQLYGSHKYSSTRVCASIRTHFLQSARTCAAQSRWYIALRNLTRGFLRAPCKVPSEYTIICHVF